LYWSKTFTNQLSRHSMKTLLSHSLQKALRLYNIRKPYYFVYTYKKYYTTEVNQERHITEEYETNDTGFTVVDLKKKYELRDTTLDNIDKRAFKRDTSDDQTFEEWLKEIESKREKFELLQVVDKRNPVDRKSLEEIHQIYDQHIALLEES